MNDQLLTRWNASHIMNGVPGGIVREATCPGSALNASHIAEALTRRLVPSIIRRVGSDGLSVPETEGTPTPRRMSEPPNAAVRRTRPTGEPLED